MKIVIVSTPRTCSGLVTNIFANKYKLINKSEIMSSCRTHEQVVEVLKTLHTEDDFVVKITSTSLNTFSDILTHLNFPWYIFDKVILTERVSVAHQYASWILLSYSQKNGKQSSTDIHAYLHELLMNDCSQFIIRPRELKFIARDINYYYQTLKPYLLQQNLPLHTVTHEMFQTTEYIDELNQLLNENFTYSDIPKTSKSSIDYSKFIMETNLTQLIQNTNND